MNLRSLAAIGTLCFAAANSLAWSEDGHRQIADIAWTKLSPLAQSKLGKILATGEPTFRPLEGNVRESFRAGSAWPDFIKGKKPSAYEEEITRYNRLFDPNIDETSSEGTRCKKWHYLDIPIRYKGERPADEKSNALAAMDLAFAELARLNSTNADLRMQAWWVYWITHVVGDVHQPLHCTSSHHVHEEGDAGGNKFDILQEGKKRRLHGFWDGAIGRAIAQDREAGLSPSVEDVSSRWLQDAANQPSTDEALCTTVKHWIDEGARLADVYVYKGVNEGEEPSATYQASTIKLSKQMAVLAGTRLAAVLNRLLK